MGGSFNNIKKLCERDLADILEGSMELEEMNKQLTSILSNNSPEYMIITIQKNEALKKYHTTVYITKGDFKKYKK